MPQADSSPDLDPSVVAAKFQSQRRRARTEEYRHAYTRLFLVGCVAWPAFGLHDVAAAYFTGHQAALPWILSMRGLGECIALPCFLLIRSGRVSPRVMVAFDYLIFGLGGALLGLMTLALDGLMSRYTQGTMIFAFARCTIFPAEWKRAVPVPATCIAMYPIALVVAQFFDPTIHAQWRDPAATGILFDNEMFVVAGVAVAILGSHLIAHAQRQVREARQLGDYRLKFRIGRGAAGDVWVARQESLDRDVALKVLRQEAWRSEEAVRRFTREARAASRLEHPNTIRVYDFGASDDGVLFIAMELLEGLDLDALVGENGACGAARAIHFLRQACASIADAHRRGVLHRDIKPANLFAGRVGDRYDVVKVLDFGVARMQGRANMTEEGILVGTPDFMAPEACAGDTTDARSDVYALGASLYFVLTGTALFPGKSLTEVIMAHISRVPDLPSRRESGVPDDLERVVMKCLEKEPGKRYQTVNDLDAALAGCRDAGKWTADDARSWWQMRGTARVRVSVG
jgi:tRNA A-37 threonylcarbamoyl transferase component Bud32